MSKWVIVVPGIMGSSLRLGNDEVWPPSAWDVITGYDRINELMDDEVEVGTIIHKIAVVSVYKSLISDVERCGYTEAGTAKRLVEFPYDWRRSNSVSAERLADRLDALSDPAGSGTSVPDDITFVAHSMGGLVVRRILEGGDYADRRWFDKVSRLITLGTPHFGAPLALARLQGKEKVLGVDGSDIVQLASDPRYTSSYELAGPIDSAFAMDRPTRGRLPRALDRFGAEYVATLDLQQPNIEAGNEFWSHLDLERRPEDVEYFFVGGAAHSTTTSCQSNTATFSKVVAESAGDGTVPVTSAVVRQVPHIYSRKAHVKVFEDRSVREALYDFLDAPTGVYPQAANDQPVAEAGVVGLSVGQSDYLVGEPIEIVVSYATPINQPRDTFGLERLHESAPAEFVDSVAISLDAPGVSHFVVTIRPELPPGVYRLTTSRPTDDPEPTIFRVVSP